MLIYGQMEVLYWGIAVFYIFLLIIVTFYCLQQLHLLYWYFRPAKKVLSASVSFETFSEMPTVTIQLPVFNERYVVERLIETVIRMDYPKDLLEIQVLDDSTDVTTTLAAAKISEFQRQGFDIQHIRRCNREGYKAGALQHGLITAKGAYIAIFDADFLPEPGFLKMTLPHFENEKVAVVQTRWAHLNEKYALLTRLQALQLNVHFRIEQSGRFNAGYFLQFNGTAGIWRRSAIMDSGGWKADTLTEDLDLSIRAQLKAWKIIYIDAIATPAELPVEINSLKTQQFRWMKGGAETARKLLLPLWQSAIPFGQKFQASLLLLSSSVFIPVFLLGILSVLLLFLEQVTPGNQQYFNVFFIGWLSISVVYFVANLPLGIRKGKALWIRILRFLIDFPLFLCLSMAFSFQNSLAVLEGFLGKKSPFHRTPKIHAHHLKSSDYKASTKSLLVFGEGILMLIYLMAVFYGLLKGVWMFLLFHSLLSFGYGFIFVSSLRSLRP